MIEIDAGAGGQVLRTSIGLSALLGKEVKVFNIRKNRPKPGLFPQHLTGIKTTAVLTNAKVKGTFPGSTEIFFSPKEFKGQNLNVNIGTAGSIMLLLQELMLPSLLEETKLRVIGGTDVKFAPSFHYFKEVLFPALSKVSAKFDLKILKHGFFPKGGGVVSFKSHKIKKLKQISFKQRKKLVAIKVFSHSSGLPKKVALTQVVAAKKKLQHLNTELIEEINCFQNTASVGCAIDLIACFKDGVRFGANALGEKGKPAQQVGGEAAQNLLAELNSKAVVDTHLADQLLPFMALGGNQSTIVCAKETAHIKSNIDVLEKFLNVKFIKEQKEDCVEISVKGARFF